MKILRVIAGPNFGADAKTLRFTNKAIFESKLLYCIGALSTSSQFHLKGIETVINKAATKRTEKRIVDVPLPGSNGGFITESSSMHIRADGVKWRAANRCAESRHDAQE